MIGYRLKDAIISPEELKAQQQLEDEFWKRAMWRLFGGKADVPEPPKPRRVWAIIKVDGKQRTTYMNPDTMEAYVTKDYECTDEKIPSFEFVRWARGMDL